MTSSALQKSGKLKGFTLVELLVVITILAILTTAGFIVYSGVQKNARDARRKADLSTINTYLETYYSSFKKYPQAGTCDYGSNCYVYSTTGDQWIPALISTNIASRLPVDPTNNAVGPWEAGNYSYSYGNVTSDGQGYDLTTKLENSNDPDRCAIKHWKFYFDSTKDWCGSYSPQIYEASPDR